MSHQQDNDVLEITCSGGTGNKLRMIRISLNVVACWFFQKDSSFPVASTASRPEVLASLLYFLYSNQLGVAVQYLVPLSVPMDGPLLWCRRLHDVMYLVAPEEGAVTATFDTNLAILPSREDEARIRAFLQAVEDRKPLGFSADTPLFGLA